MTNTEQARWESVLRRDASGDGLFYFAVRSTGVYCRPSCAARRPKRENVEFFPSPESAERAGYRACRRCKPKDLSQVDRYTKVVASACRAIENAEHAPDLQSLAQTSGMSRFHFHRVFKSIAGVTPKAYAQAHRARRTRRQLSRSRTVTDAIYRAGFNSSGRFYADAPQRLGMTPARFRKGGERTAVRFATGRSSLGAVLVGASDRGVCWISLGDRADEMLRNLREQFPRASISPGNKTFDRWVARVVAFVDQPHQALNLPLDIRGTAFQQRVWQALREIPPGRTMSYTQVAKEVGMPAAVRAVAGACAANPISLAIPCHRVVRRDGSLSGYRWGVERKRALLAREQSHDAESKSGAR